MERYNVSVADHAKADLRETTQYISSQLSAPAAALRLADAFDEAFVELEDMPEKYPLVPDDRLAALGYRKRRIKNYLMFFTISEESHAVYVERILYARRDWKNIL